MHAIFLSENECTVSEREFNFNGADSKVSSTMKSSKVYLSIDIKSVGVITKERT